MFLRWLIASLHLLALLLGLDAVWMRSRAHQVEVALVILIVFVATALARGVT